jgi:hypothetical protein
LDENRSSPDPDTYRRPDCPRGFQLHLDPQIRGRATAIHFDAQTLTSIDNNAKTYTVTKFGDVGQTLKNSDVDVKVYVKKTGETRNINGYNTSEAVMTMDIDNPQGPGGWRENANGDTYVALAGRAGGAGAGRCMRRIATAFPGPRWAEAETKACKRPWRTCNAKWPT